MDFCLYAIQIKKKIVYIIFLLKSILLSIITGVNNYILFMKKIILTLIFIMYALFIFSQNQLKVLFIGNSLTGFNDLPGLFQELSIESGKSVYVDKCYHYGQVLRNYINDQRLIDKIDEKEWDYVILQSDDITAFDDMYNIEINTLTKCKEYIHANNPNTKIIYEMIWGLRDGYYGWYTYGEYIYLIYNGTLYIADQLDLIVAPVGWAWKKCKSLNPEIELFAADKAHPTYPGSYLGASVFYNIIWQEKIENNSFYGQLSGDKSTFLQSVANSVVQDNIELWYYNNDENDDTTTEVLNYIKQNSLKISIIPNPSNGIFNLSFKNTIIKNCKIEIYNNIGNKVYSENVSRAIINKHRINLTHKSKGIYFLRITADNKSIVKEIVIK